MKILQINSVGNSGSTGRIAEQIGLEIIKNGGESYIACARNISTSQSNLIKIGTKLHVYLNVLWFRIFGTDGPFSILPTKKLIKQIKEINPDIIHLHNTHGYYLNNSILLKFLAEYNKPVVWTIHSCWIFTGHCTHFDFVRCDKWKTSCSNCPQLRYYPKTYFFDRSTEIHKSKRSAILKIKNLTFTPVSDWLAGLIKESAYSNYKTIAVRNGLALDMFKPTAPNIILKYNIPAKKIVLFVASPWTQRKGFHYIPNIQKKLGDDFVCVVVGVNSKQKEFLKKYNIIAIERTENVRELCELYTIASVFANPTLEEALSMVNLEALACGTPVVTFNSGGTKETITNTEIGSVIEHNEDIMCQEIIRFSNIDKKLISKKCRQSVEENFDKNHVWQKYINIYKNILNNS
ncbi:MAG: glycosyltransferase [Opitutales bacterium]|nr:glycosyltransferase [Opitutales bacterium]